MAAEPQAGGSGSPPRRVTTAAAERRPRIESYAWVVFALTFGLLISDYMARQVLNAVFPLLKADWALSDGQLGFLSGVVALMVGLLTFPISLLADRIGRVKSIAIMAALWSVATLLCGLAQNYEQMLAAVDMFETEIRRVSNAHPIDPTLRTLEVSGPKCQICSNKAEWVRSTQFSGDHLFCKLHAEAEEDFGDSNPSYFFWKELDPITT